MSWPGHQSISTVDGIQGRLIYRGLDIRDLVANSTFEETTYLLWHGALPHQSELDDLHHKLTVGPRPCRPRS